MEDVEALKNSRNQFIRGWVSSHLGELHQITSAVNALSELEFGPIYLGKVQWKSLDDKHKRVYWYDANDHSKPHYEHISDPDHRLRGIKPRNIRNTLRQGFEIDQKYFSTLRSPAKPKLFAIPRSEDKAATIEQIKDNIVEIREIVRGHAHHG
ncbi:hypothetical protein [Nitrososphaera sp.]|uniref:hypothetical protein n=1 Tax=Nitrososphaera sp. TaxID=1971748 RepID=UPI002ED7D569